MKRIIPNWLLEMWSAMKRWMQRTIRKAEKQSQDMMRMEQEIARLKEENAELREFAERIKAVVAMEGIDLDGDEESDGNGRGEI